MKTLDRYPDAESVKAMIRIREETGLPLGSLSLNQGSHADVNLHKAGCRWFGSWREAIEASGLNYVEIYRRRSLYPNAASVIREIRERHVRNHPLDAASVNWKSGPHRNIPLYNAAKKHFGGWVEAVEAAGLEYPDICQRTSRRYNDQASVIDEIRRRQKEGMPLNYKDVGKGEFADSPLVRWGRSYFGSWKAAIEAAGLSYDDVCITRTLRYPDRDSVVQGIQDRFRNGIPVSKHCASMGEHTDIALRSSAVRFFGGWKDAVEASGINYSDETGKKSKYADGEAVVEEIKRRHKAGIPVNASSVNNGAHREACLMTSAKKHFGSWAKALNEAGLDASRIQQEARQWKKKYADGAAVISAIRERDRLGLPLTAIILSKAGEHSDCALYDSGRTCFGSWAKAIRAAGIDTADSHLKKTGAKAQKRLPVGVKYPDRESVLKEIRTRRKEGKPLRAGKMVGANPHPDQSLYYAGRRFFATWENAVEAAGFSYEKLPRKSAGRGYPDADAVIAEIRRRGKAGIPVKCISVISGKNASKALYHAALAYFEGWRAAVAAAGFDYDEVSRREMKPRKHCKRKYADANAVIREIKARRENGLPINCYGVIDGEYRDGPLYGAAKAFLGGWANALETAGFNPKEVSRAATPPPRKKYPTPESVLAEIKRRKKAGLPVYSRAVDMPPETRDRMLLRYGLKYFGTWKNAVETAGFDYKNCLPRTRFKYPDSDAVIDELRHREKKGIGLSSSALLSGKHRDQALYCACKRDFGNWRNAGREAGVFGAEGC